MRRGQRWRGGSQRGGGRPISFRLMQSSGLAGPGFPSVWVVGGSRLVRSPVRWLRSPALETRGRPDTSWAARTWRRRRLAVSRPQRRVYPDRVLTQAAGIGARRSAVESLGLRQR